MPSRKQILDAISNQAAAIQQSVDDACMQKLAELSDAQMQTLHQHFTEKIVQARSPIRNISAVVLSMTRTILSDTEGASIVVPSAAADGAQPPFAMRPQGSVGLLAHSGCGGSGGGCGGGGTVSSMGGRPMGGDGGGGGSSSVRQLLEENGIYGVDDMAMSKISEMSPQDQVALIQMFLTANQDIAITSPSKWLFAKARTHLVQQRLSGAAGPKEPVDPTDQWEIPELPGIFVDGKCNEKMQELEPEERAQVLQLFQEEIGKQAIRNPSGWLFAKSRTALVQRSAGGVAAGGGGGGGGGGRVHQLINTAALVNYGVQVPGQRPQAPAPEPFGEGVDPFAALAEIGVDDLALSKLQELDNDDMKRLLGQFQQLHSAGQIGDPSKWLFSKARTIAAQLSQQKLALKRQDLQNGGGHGGGCVVIEGVPELEGMTLDDKAMEKVNELEDDERTALFQELAAEAARRPIGNPSGWVFSRARTKVVDRMTGRPRQARRASPY